MARQLGHRKRITGAGMSQVIYTLGALRSLHRLHDFLRTKNPDAARRAADTIRRALQMLSQQPHIGRPVEDLPEQYREWLINFGDSGYVAMYRIDDGVVTVLALRHQKEAGFG